MWRLGLVLVLVAACSQPASRSCTPPAHTTYTCAPLPPGSAGCLGGPKWSTDNYQSDAAPIQQDDPDEVFPSGCHAFIPDCSPYYKGTAREFECGGSGWAELL